MVPTFGKGVGMEEGDPQRQPHSIWLRPAEDVAEEMRDDIGRVCKLSGGPLFEPHVTLLGDLSGPPDKIHFACESVFRQTNAIPVKAIGLASTNQFFMSLFLELDVPAALYAARADIAERLSVQPPPFRPHISLAYGYDAQAAPAGVLDDLKTKYVGRAFCLSTIAAVASASTIPIEKWKIVSSQSFSV